MTGNDARVAAHVIAGGRGYRVQVIAELARRGFLPVTVSPSVLVPASPADMPPAPGPIRARLPQLHLLEAPIGPTGQEPAVSP